MDRSAVAALVTFLVMGALAFVVLSTITGGIFYAPPPATTFLLVLIFNFAVIGAAFVHALARPDLTGVQRIVWIAIAVFVTPAVALGAAAYFLLGRRRTASLFRDLGGGGAALPPAPRHP